MASRIIDADSHVVEPSDLWENYLEPEYRERAMRLKLDDQGLEYIEIDGKPSPGMTGGGFAGAMAAGRDDIQEFSALPFEKARELVPPARDPHERVKWLDQEGVDATLLYPSLGLDWPQDCADAELSAAYCRAYNTWLDEFCTPHPERLLGIAHISLLDLEEGIGELRRAVKLGMKGVYPPVVPFNGIPYGESHYDSFWAEAQSMNIPVSLHVTGHSLGLGTHLYPKDVGPPSGWWVLVMDVGDVISTFTSLFQGGLFDRFPAVKIVVVETGSGWLPWWLERMDHLFDKLSFEVPLKLRPSEYFERQCWILVDPDEKTVAATLSLVGHDRFIWGSDYPHTEGEAGALEELKENMAPLPGETQRKILGETAVELYGLKS